MTKLPYEKSNPSEFEHYIYHDEKYNIIIYDFISGSSMKFKDVTPKVNYQFGVQLGKQSNDNHKFILINF